MWPSASISPKGKTKVLSGERKEKQESPCEVPDEGSDAAAAGEGETYHFVTGGQEVFLRTSRFPDLISF